MPEIETQATGAEVTLKGRFLDQETDIESLCFLVFKGGEEVQIVTTAIPALGSPVLCYTDTVGRITGIVTGTERGGFTLRPTGSEAMLARVYKRLRWLQENGQGTNDLRGDTRFVPTQVDTEIRIAGDDVAVKGDIVDVSRSGVRVRTVLALPVGTRVYVGKRGADIVRQLDGEFAARFVIPLPVTDLDAGIRL
jgi:hypothetical protein